MRENLDTTKEHRHCPICQRLMNRIYSSGGTIEETAFYYCAKDYLLSMDIHDETYKYHTNRIVELRDSIKK